MEEWIRLLLPPSESEEHVEARTSLDPRPQNHGTTDPPFSGPTAREWEGGREGEGRGSDQAKGEQPKVSTGIKPISKIPSTKQRCARDLKYPRVPYCWDQFYPATRTPNYYLTLTTTTTTNRRHISPTHFSHTCFELTSRAFHTLFIHVTQSTLCHRHFLHCSLSTKADATVTLLRPDQLPPGQAYHSHAKLLNLTSASLGILLSSLLVIVAHDGPILHQSHSRYFEFLLAPTTNTSCCFITLPGSHHKLPASLEHGRDPESVTGNSIKGVTHIPPASHRPANVQRAKQAARAISSAAVGRTKRRIFHPTAKLPGMMSCNYSSTALSTNPSSSILGSAQFTTIPEPAHTRPARRHGHPTASSTSTASRILSSSSA